MIKNIILTISILLNVTILAFAIWTYIMFNQGMFSYAMTNIGVSQLCADGVNFEDESQNEAAKKWCEKLTKAMEAPSVKEQEKVEKNEEVEPVQQTEETAEIIQKISEYCVEHNIPECSIGTSYYVVDDSDDKYRVVRVSGFNYLLTKTNSEWDISIVSQEDNICDTGSDNADLVEYCSN